MKREALFELYRDFYKRHPFVLIYDLPKDENTSWQYRPYPWVSAVAGTNFCYIGLDIDEQRERIVVLSVLDSIGKGGAQVGVENMNIMFGLDRTTGLARRGMHPG
jgi:N-acetyl-gamma-glutamylphosphate reductase